MKKALALCFTVLMLAVCAYVVMQSLAIDRLDYEIREMRTELNTNRQRERKQQVEYDQAAEQLPGNQARLAEIKPDAETLKASETELRARRKTLRSEVDTLQAETDAAEIEAGKAEQQLTESREACAALETEAWTLLQHLGEEARP